MKNKNRSQAARKSVDFCQTGKQSENENRAGHAHRAIFTEYKTSSIGHRGCGPISHASNKDGRHVASEAGIGGKCGNVENSAAKCDSLQFPWRRCPCQIIITSSSSSSSSALTAAAA